MKFLSQAWVIARGSIGGITYTANQFHQLIARARTSPVNPGTSLQTAIRSAFTGAETLWKALTDRDRTDWDLYAKLTPRQNPLGPITLTGRTFMRGIIALREYIAAQLAIIFIEVDTAPLTPGMLNIINVVATPPGGPAVTGVAIAWGNPLANPDIVVMAQLSPAFDPTRLSYKGPWDTAKNQAVETPAAATGIAEFLELVEGKAYFIRIRAIVQKGPHSISEDFIVRMIAVTVVI